MAINKDNLASISFSATDLQQLQNAMNSIDTLLDGKVLNLTAEERQQLGSIKETNKLFVNKVRDFMQQNPTQVPQFVDTAEFEKDFQARTHLEQALMRINAIKEKLEDTKIALDSDNYSASLVVYKYLQFLASQNVPGMTSWEMELKQFFPRTKKKDTTEVEETTEEEE
jgi:hypothetical protein